jgi:hypothetical protein
MYIHDLDRGESFTFKGDTNRPKDIYWFLKMDGAYAQIFSTKAAMKSFDNPAFVSASTIVERTIEKNT